MASPKSKTKTMSGGATFTPRLPDGRRPTYPSTSVVCRKAVGEFLRTGVVCVLLTRLFFPLYLTLVASLTAPGTLNTTTVTTSTIPAANNGKFQLNLDERGAFTLLTCLAHTGTYVAVCGGMELVRWTGLWRKYEFRRLPHQVPSQSLVWQTILLAAVGQLIATPLGLWGVGYAMFKRFGMPELDAELPSNVEMFKCFVIAKAINEWGFYWAHRTLHTKALYKRIHKLHHSYTGSIPITSEFSTIPEVCPRNGYW